MNNYSPNTRTEENYTKLTEREKTFSVLGKRKKRHAKKNESPEIYETSE